MSGLTKNPLAGLAALGLAGMAPSNTGGLNPTGECSKFPYNHTTFGSKALLQANKTR